MDKDQSKPQDVATEGVAEELAKLAEPVPKYGPFIAVILRSKYLFVIVRGLLWLLVYPVFAFVVAICTIGFMPDTPKAWVQDQANQALQIDGKIIAAERIQFNNSNKVIDGSTLLDFEVFETDPPKTYIQQITLDQPVSLLTYQDWESAVKGESCAPQLRSGDQMGTLTMSPVGADTSNSNPFRVMYSHDDFSHVMSETGGPPIQRVQALSDPDWKMLHDAVMPSSGGAAPEAIDVRLQFAPDARLWKDNPNCRFKIYVLMTYRKLPLK